ncbi:hypothetical protein J4G37_24975 [Microvirga sp. 3-52]|nr:hypothetical protein [Microvirga sp. 3-52]
MNETELLQKHIPYRMQAVDTLNYALRLRSSWSNAPSMTIHVDGKQVMESNLNAFTNPAIEAGLVHCRVLLEFFGLCEKGGSLSNRKKRQPSDIGIEQFKNAAGPLKMVDPEMALSRYEGDKEEAEKALLTVFHITNKGLAHITADLAAHPAHARLLEIASRGIPALVISYLYTPLGLAAPNYKITSRPREA